MKGSQGATSEAHRRLTFLGSSPWPSDEPTGPYRIDHLEARGWDVLTTNSHRTGPLGLGRTGTAVRSTERLLPLWAQTVASRTLRASSDATLAMFEGEGHSLALARSLHIAQRTTPFVIVACWLADLVQQATPAQLCKYRLAYREVDRVVVFSNNQVEVLVEGLRIPQSRVSVVPFGVDLDEFIDCTPRQSAVASSSELKVVAVGRDASRDWPTLAAAATGAAWTADLYTRPSLLAGLGLPPQVAPHAMVNRAEYLRVMGTADVMLVPTGVHQYPAGQSVLGEAMAAGVACVVTDTPALRSYATDEVDSLLVPPGDAAALRSAVERLADPKLRIRLGAAAQKRMRRHGGAQTMWAGIDEVLRQAIAQRAS
jgi:glycosyltransferase involved in cell wall biosynthesis